MPAVLSKPTTARQWPVGLVRAAYWVSILGNPLFTALFFLGGLGFRLLDARTATWVVLAMLLGVALPIGLWTRRQVRSGAYANFDVSVREQRRSFYPRLIGLLLVPTAALFATDSTAPLRIGFVTALGLLGLCYLINFRLKVSLHAALSFFMAGCVANFGVVWCLPALGLAALVAASRLVLGRHSGAELLVGTLAGLAAGACVSWMGLA